MRGKEEDGRVDTGRSTLESCVLSWSCGGGGGGGGGGVELHR